MTTPVLPLTDSNGIPAPKVTYSISDNTRAMLRHGSNRATEVIYAAGAVNPTSTIQALALYISDCIKTNISE